MGAVYHAEDMILGRAVALKILSDRSLGEERARSRVLREARAAAALSHPNVCTIFEAGEADSGLFSGFHESFGERNGSSRSAPYLAMEFIEGRTLDALHRDRRVLPLAELVDLALQIAEGLSAAHQRGIVHRDLKPGNVMVTPDGRAKVLDFGLARPVDAPSGLGVPDSPLETVTCELLREGRVLGTAAYISPERALGKSGDSRSDVFSYGVMLYEMVSGQRPFQADTTTAVIAKVLEAEPPPLAGIRPDTPPELARIVARCLRKNPEDRFNDTRDLVAALRELRENLGRLRSNGAVTLGRAGDVTDWVQPPPGATMKAGVSVGTSSSPKSPPHSRVPLVRRRVWITGILLIAASAVTAILLTRWISPRPGSPTSHVTRITMTGDIRSPVISPDGNFVVYNRVRPGVADAVFVYDLRSGATLQIFQGGIISLALAWSPDGSALAIPYFSSTTGGGEIVSVPLLGGAAKLLSREHWMAICWSPDGRRLAGWDGEHVVILDWATSAKSVLASVKARNVLALAWSPHADRILLSVRSDQNKVSFWSLDPVGGTAAPLVGLPPAKIGAVWAPDGRSFYFVRSPDDALVKVAVNPRTGEASGPVVPLGQTIVSPWTPSISRDGKRMVYAPITMGTEIVRTEIRARDGGGSADSPVNLTTSAVSEGAPRVSPDGRQMLFTRFAGSSARTLQSLVIADLDSVTDAALTSNFVNGMACWSPSGREVAYMVPGDSGAAIHIVSLDTRQHRIIANAIPNEIFEWSPGEDILCRTPDGQNYQRIDPMTGRIRLLLSHNTKAVWQVRSSPDGRFAAFARTDDMESGMSVQLVSLADGAERLLYPGRAAPVGWSRDAKTVYLVRENPEAAAEGRRVEEIVACPVEGGAVGRLCTIPDPARWSFVDVSSDGRRVVSTRPRSSGDAWLIENFDPDVR